MNGRDKDPYNLDGKPGYKVGKWAFSADYTYSEHVNRDKDKAISAAASAVWNTWGSVQFYGAYRWHKLDRSGISPADGLRGERPAR